MGCSLTNERRASKQQLGGGQHTSCSSASSSQSFARPCMCRDDRMLQRCWHVCQNREMRGIF